MISRYEILPITGSSFETLSKWSQEVSANHRSELQQFLNEKIAHPHPSQRAIDLNHVFLELMVLEFLFFMTTQQSHAVLEEQTLLQLASQSELFEQRFQTMKLSQAQLEHKFPRTVMLLTPLFETYFHYGELFRAEWKQLENQWRQNKDNSPVFTNAMFGDPHAAQVLEPSQEQGHEEKELPKINWLRWKFLQNVLRVLSLELQHRWTLMDHLGSIRASAEHPVVSFLRQEMTNFVSKTHGLELLEPVSLIKVRLQQLAKYLQPACEHGWILPPAFLTTSAPLPVPSLFQEESKEAQPRLQKKHWALAACLFLLVVAGLYGSRLKDSENPSRAHSGFTPPTFFKETLKFPQTQIKAIVEKSKLDLPMLPYSLEFQSEIERLAVAEEGDAYPFQQDSFLMLTSQNIHLVWTQQLFSFEELDAFADTLTHLQALKQRVAQMSEVLMPAFPQYQLSIQPLISNGTPSYGLFLETQGVLMGNITPSKEGFNIRWGSSQIVLPLDDPQRLIQVIQNFEKPASE